QTVSMLQFIIETRMKLNHYLNGKNQEKQSLHFLLDCTILTWFSSMVSKHHQRQLGSEPNVTLVDYLLFPYGKTG
ncbi:hypothetical protein PJP07_31415, partial [Mycobacterium kansasii]